MSCFMDEVNAPFEMNGAFLSIRWGEDYFFQNGNNLPL